MVNASFLQRLRSDMGALREQGLYKGERVLTTPQGGLIRTGEREVLNLCANNYLGLANHPAVREAAHRALDRHGYGMASVPRKRLKRSSSCLCTPWVPQMKRTEAIP